MNKLEIEARMLEICERLKFLVNESELLVDQCNDPNPDKQTVLLRNAELVQESESLDAEVDRLSGEWAELAEEHLNRKIASKARSSKSLRKSTCIVGDCPVQFRGPGCGYLDAMRVTSSLQCRHTEYRGQWKATQGVTEQ